MPSPVREAIEAFIAAEFALERGPSPEQFASGFIEALEQGGLSEKDAVRTVAAFVNLGNCFSFGDRRTITAALAATYPDWPMPDSLVPSEARPEATLPPGGVMVSCYDVLDPDMLFLARRTRKDPDWLPASAFDVPIECNVEAHFFVIDSPGVTGEHDTLRVTGTMELFVERAGEERRTVTREHLTYTEAVGPGLMTDIPSCQIHVPRSVFPLPDDARLLLEVRYDVVHHAPGVPPDERAAIAGSVLYRVVPRVSANATTGDHAAAVERLEVRPLGPDGEELPCPEVLQDYRLQTNLLRFVLGGKSGMRERFRERVARDGKVASLVGRDLVAVPLIRGPDGMPGELALGADRPHILLFGATWCGPCHERAPSVKELVEALAGRDGAPLVHRLSIDDDPDAFDAALAAYPSGICTDDFEEDFVVDAVPKYYLVREGKVVEQGVVSEEGITAWREQYAP
ncbi:MAG: thioredoxin family protein [Planctomycetaceae bacterium]